MIATMLTGLGIDQYFARTDSNGTLSYLTSRLGSTIALANSSGTIATQYSYEPYGKTTVTGSSTNPFQFTGRENDGTGLYYYRARYYSPTLGRFISQDPLGFMAGPNLYAYVLNSPTNVIDPFGLLSGMPFITGPINGIFNSGPGSTLGGAFGAALFGGLTTPAGPEVAIPAALVGGAIGGRIGSIFDSPCSGELNCGEDEMLAQYQLQTLLNKPGPVCDRNGH